MGSREADRKGSLRKEETRGKQSEENSGCGIKGLQPEGKTLAPLQCSRWKTKDWKTGKSK